MAKKGVLFGIGAYLIWGFFPLYFKMLQEVPALQIMFHRMVWSFLLLILLIFIKREWPSLKEQIAQPRILLIYALSGGLLSMNWLVFIWGVNSDHVVETSLGYFINPLVSVLLGVIFLKERLRPMQWVPVGLAAAGVIYLTLEYGALPWIALALAFSFGMYGLVKKVSPLGAFHSLTLETGIISLPALLYLLYAQYHGSGSFGHSPLQVSLLLAISGAVTVLPLLLFGSAARAIPLSTVGILQYITPTCHFLLGVLVFSEPFDLTQLAGFATIWLALGIYSMEGLLVRRSSAAAPSPAD